VDGFGLAELGNSGGVGRRVYLCKTLTRAELRLQMVLIWLSSRPG